MRESDFQRRITDLCDWLGLKWHHETDSRRSKKGFPDLVIAGEGGVIFVELKSDKGRIRPEQAEWLYGLEKGGAEVHLWRPNDWEAAKARLTTLARSL